MARKGKIKPNKANQNVNFLCSCDDFQRSSGQRVTVVQPFEQELINVILRPLLNTHQTSVGAQGPNLQT